VYNIISIQYIEYLSKIIWPFWIQSSWKIIIAVIKNKKYYRVPNSTNILSMSYEHLNLNTASTCLNVNKYVMKTLLIFDLQIQCFS